MAPLSLISLLIALVYVPDSRDTSAPRELDLLGCALIVCSLATLTMAVERGDAWGWDSARTLGFFSVAVVTGGLFLVRERLASHPLIDLRLFRNVPYVLVTGMGSLSNMGYAVTVFLATLYLQGVRGLSPLLAGTVFLAPALLVALSGPLGARLAQHMRPTAVMALAGAVAGTGMYALTLVTAWWLYVPVFAWCGLGLGLGWTFSSVATQQVVPAGQGGGGIGRTADVPGHAGCDRPGRDGGGDLGDDAAAAARGGLRRDPATGRGGHPRHGGRRHGRTPPARGARQDPAPVDAGTR